MILGLETSCDETSAAIVADGFAVRSNVVSSQIARHAEFGGVVPELAAREHLRNIDTVVNTAMQEAGITAAELTAIAATTHPGLVPALLVGVSYARGLAWTGDLPFFSVNHFLGHIYSAFLDAPQLLSCQDSYPLLAAVVSGGHTALVVINAAGAAEIIGRTLDDAAGEAFDKAAKIMGLGYPGGPQIETLARTGDPARFDFPRGLRRHRAGGRKTSADNRFNFSFSGLKTALLYSFRDSAAADSDLADLAAGFQAAIVDILAEKAIDAVQKYQVRTLVLCGGVACNGTLRETMHAAAAAAGVKLQVAKPEYCTDNAAMIAGLAWHYQRREQPALLTEGISARLPANLGRLPFVP